MFRLKDLLRKPLPNKYPRPNCFCLLLPDSNTAPPFHTTRIFCSNPSKYILQYCPDCSESMPVRAVLPLLPAHFPTLRHSPHNHSSNLSSYHNSRSQSDTHRNIPSRYRRNICCLILLEQNMCHKLIYRRYRSACISRRTFHCRRLSANRIKIIDHYIFQHHLHH